MPDARATRLTVLVIAVLVVLVTVDTAVSLAAPAPAHRYSHRFGIGRALTVHRTRPHRHPFGGSVPTPPALTLPPVPSATATSATPTSATPTSAAPTSAVPTSATPTSTAPTSATPTSAVPSGSSVATSPASAPTSGAPTTSQTSAAPSAAPTTTAPTTHSTSVGLLGPTSKQQQSLAGSAVTRMMIPIGWDVIEPQQNVFNTDALTQVGSQIAALHKAGYQVVLDLGLQYPPSWVFSLPGFTRFVNQYGDVWHASLSEDVPNAVFDPAVRSAEATYIQQVAASLGSTTFASIRVGGLLSGELRYPDADYNGHTDSLWDYDPTAQASAPYPGWTPGTGTQAQMQGSLQYYFDSLTSYETWLMATVSAAFPGVNQQILFPGWGIRPGMTADAISSGMTDQSNAEVNGMISSGLDWADQVKAISDAGINGTVYTTWLDAPTQSNSVQGEAPVDYLASLATQYNLPIAGENTGGGGTSALNLCVQRVQADHLSSFMYMDGSMIDNGSAGIALSDLTSAASTLAK